MLQEQSPRMAQQDREGPVQRPANRKRLSQRIKRSSRTQSRSRKGLPQEVARRYHYRHIRSRRTTSRREGA
jgi:hypothetical protein